METSIWAHHEGTFFWGVGTPLAAGDIFLWADRVEVRDGCLLFFGPEDMLNASFAPGQWNVVFHARSDDGVAAARDLPRNKKASK